MGAKEGVAYDTDWVIKKRMKLDNHMQDHHPDQCWTPISMAMIQEDDDKHELAEMLLRDPNLQFDDPKLFGRASKSEPISIVDEGWSAKVRKRMKESMTVNDVICKIWERFTHQLLFVKHRQSDMMWSRVVQYIVGGWATDNNTTHMKDNLMQMKQQLDDED